MRKRRQFTNEFKLEAVRLAERGEVPVAQVARELDLNETVLRRWMGLYGKRAGANRLTPEEHDELIRLRREVRRVTEERDILKRAVSIFSKELRGDTHSSGSTGGRSEWRPCAAYGRRRPAGTSPGWAGPRARASAPIECWRRASKPPMRAAARPTGGGAFTSSCSGKE